MAAGAGLVSPRIGWPSAVAETPEAESPTDYTLRITASPIEIAPKRIVSGITYNGQFPGPLLRFKEGAPVTVEVQNDGHARAVALARTVCVSGSGWRGGRRHAVSSCAWHAAHHVNAAALGFSQAQTADSGFPKGELSTAKNHTGNIWLSQLNAGDGAFDPRIDMATYDAGAKLDWHSHPGGQVLLITEGTGYYQERGKPARIVHKGDVIKCAAGVEHWHGATPRSGFAYLAVTPTQKGKTIWLEPVSDKDYNSAK